MGFAERIDEPGAPPFITHPNMLFTFPELKKRASVTPEEFVRLSLIEWLGSWYAGRWWADEPAPDEPWRVEKPFVRRWVRIPAMLSAHSGRS
jgi:hypothetical protein